MGVVAQHVGVLMRGATKQGGRVADRQRGGGGGQGGAHTGWEGRRGHRVYRRTHCTVGWQTGREGGTGAKAVRTQVGRGGGGTGCTAAHTVRWGGHKVCIGLDWMGCMWDGMCVAVACGARACVPLHELGHISVTIALVLVTEGLTQGGTLLSYNLHSGGERLNIIIITALLLYGGVTQLEVSIPHGECFQAAALNCKPWNSVPLKQ